MPFLISNWYVVRKISCPFGGYCLENIALVEGLAIVRPIHTISAFMQVVKHIE
jgi:hypothetical protein